MSLLKCEFKRSSEGQRRRIKCDYYGTRASDQLYTALLNLWTLVMLKCSTLFVAISNAGPEDFDLHYLEGIGGSTRAIWRSTKIPGLVNAN